IWRGRLQSHGRIKHLAGPPFLAPTENGENGENGAASTRRRAPARTHSALGGRSRPELIELQRHGAPEIAAAHRDAVAVEEFQDQDRDLAAVVELVAELRGGEVAG